MLSVKDTFSRFRLGIRAHRRIGTIKSLGTRMDPREARLYTDYLEKCRAAFRDESSIGSDPNVPALAKDFLTQGFTTFQTGEIRALAESILEKIRREETAGENVWSSDQRYLLGDVFQKFPEIEALFRGTTGEFLRRIYGAHFKIFYGVLMKSVHSERPSGSQLWHADGGPGTCVNLMFCLSEVDPGNGAMEALPWPESLDVYRNEVLEFSHSSPARPGMDKSASRELLCDFYREKIERRHRDRVVQPAAPPGLVFPFRNNILHKGGYPEIGRTRYVCIFHIYPSEEPTPFEDYRRNGVPKTGSYPKDPAFK